MKAEASGQEAEGQHGNLKAADADRDETGRVLGTAYSEGRLSKDEYDARLEAAFSARTYADLDGVVTDLPARAGTPAITAEPPGAIPRGRTSGLAIASRVLGWAALILVVVIILIAAVIAAGGMHGTMHMP
ncbi:MAG: DUF1707 SHOCT-like domain-containing protein [Trebonia sp.]